MFCLTAYGYSFYALVARDEQQGRGTPLSYCISSDDTGEVVKIFLRSLKTTAENHGFDFCPRFVGIKVDNISISISLLINTFHFRLIICLQLVTLFGVNTKSDMDIKDK